MTGEFHPGWVNGIDATAARLATGLLTAPDGTPLGSLAGIRPAPGSPGQVSIVPGSNPAAVAVNPFQAVIPDRAPGGGGAFLATLGSAQQLTLAPRDQAQQRLDLVVAEIDPSSPNGFVVHVVTGSPGSPPTPPPVKNPSYLSLAQISVPPLGSSQLAIADKRTMTAALGGVLPVASAAARPGQPYAGTYVHRLDTGALEAWTGTEWVSYQPVRRDSWHAPTLLNGWTDFGGEFTPTAYTLGQDGWVRLRGVVRGGPIDTSKPIFLLPAGYTPTFTYIYAVNSSVVQTPKGRVNVRANGAVVPEEGSDYLSLDGIAFPTY